MPANSKRLAYRLFSWGRLFLALVILALFFCVYFSQLMRWSDIRIALMSTQFTGILLRTDVLLFAAAAILAVAAFAGRWYCSVLCPFGTLQEAAWRIKRAFKAMSGKLIGDRFAMWRHRFISPWRLRYIVPVLTGIGLMFAVPQFFLTMDPISNFGRGVRSAYLLISEGAASMTFFTWAAFGMFAFILVLAAVRGRRFCDWCPAGILLGAFAPVAPFGMRLEKDACVSCGKCEPACPMSCIDAKGKFLDESRCVLCFSCAGECALGALEYGSVPAAEKAERRAFFKKSGHALSLLAGAGYLGGVALRHVIPNWVTSTSISGPIPLIMPPGARDIDHFTTNCIACKACAAACPVQIIRTDNGLPNLDFTDHYCQFGCMECSSVCPSQALRRFADIGVKQRTRIGLIELNLEHCVVMEGHACGACAEVCAPRALQMEPVVPGEPLTKPVFHPEYCIGCGGCYHVCPIRWEPRAITIAGVTPQTLTPGMYRSENGAGQGFYFLNGFPF